MNRRSLVTIAVGILGIALIIVSGQNITLLSLIGTFLFSYAGGLIGLEAIKSRKFILTSRYDRRQNETYYGIAAIIQGILLISIAVLVFLLVSSVYFDFGFKIVRYFIRHPGVPLILVGLFFLFTSVSSVIGYEEQKSGQRLNRFLELTFSRLLPGIVLFGLSSSAILLGFLEILSPEYFDNIGGGFIELIFLNNE